MGCGENKDIAICIMASHWQFKSVVTCRRQELGGEGRYGSREREELKELQAYCSLHSHKQSELTDQQQHVQPPTLCLSTSQLEFKNMAAASLAAWFCTKSPTDVLHIRGKGSGRVYFQLAAGEGNMASTDCCLQS